MNDNLNRERRLLNVGDFVFVEDSSSSKSNNKSWIDGEVIFVEKIQKKDILHVAFMNNNGEYEELKVSRFSDKLKPNSKDRSCKKYECPCKRFMVDLSKWSKGSCKDCGHSPLLHHNCDNIGQAMAKQKFINDAIKDKKIELEKCKSSKVVNYKHLQKSNCNNGKNNASEASIPCVPKKNPPKFKTTKQSNDEHKGNDYKSVEYDEDNNLKDELKDELNDLNINNINKNTYNNEYNDIEDDDEKSLISPKGSTLIKSLSITSNDKTKLNIKISGINIDNNSNNSNNDNLSGLPPPPPPLPSNTSNVSTNNTNSGNNTNNSNTSNSNATFSPSSISSPASLLSSPMSNASKNSSTKSFFKAAAALKNTSSASSNSSANTKTKSHKILVNDLDFDLDTSKFASWTCQQLFYWMKTKMNWIRKYESEKDIDFIFENQMNKFLKQIVDMELNGHKLKQVLSQYNMGSNAESTNVIIKTLKDVGFSFSQREKIQYHILSNFKPTENELK